MIEVGNTIEYYSKRNGAVRAQVIMLGQQLWHAYSHKTGERKVSVRDIIKVRVEKKESRWDYITNLSNTDNITKIG